MGKWLLVHGLTLPGYCNSYEIYLLRGSIVYGKTWRTQYGFRFVNIFGGAGPIVAIIYKLTTEIL